MNSDSANRALVGQSYNSWSMTVESCVAFCSTGGYKYAGLEFSIECCTSICHFVLRPKANAFIRRLFKFNSHLNGNRTRHRLQFSLRRQLSRGLWWLVEVGFVYGAECPDSFFHILSSSGDSYTDGEADPSPPKFGPGARSVHSFCMEIPRLLGRLDHSFIALSTHLGEQHCGQLSNSVFDVWVQRCRSRKWQSMLLWRPCRRHIADPNGTIGLLICLQWRCVRDLRWPPTSLVLYLDRCSPQFVVIRDWHQRRCVRIPHRRPHRPFNSHPCQERQSDIHGKIRIWTTELDRRLRTRFVTDRQLCCCLEADACQE